MSPCTAEPARNAGGFVDNARALPTTPPAPQQQPGRTFHSPYKADIFTRYRHTMALVDRDVLAISHRKRSDAFQGSFVELPFVHVSIEPGSARSTR